MLPTRHQRAQVGGVDGQTLGGKGQQLVSYLCPTFQKEEAAARWPRDALRCLDAEPSSQQNYLLIKVRTSSSG